MDAVSNGLCAVVDAAELARCAHAAPTMRDAADVALMRVSHFMEELNGDAELYAAARDARDALLRPIADDAMLSDGDGRGGGKTTTTTGSSSSCSSEAVATRVETRALGAIPPSESWSASDCSESRKAMRSACAVAAAFCGEFERDGIALESGERARVAQLKGEVSLLEGAFLRERTVSNDASSEWRCLNFEGG